MILASVSLPVTRAGCVKTAKWIKVLFEVETAGDPKNTVLDGGPHPRGEGGGLMRPLPNYFGYLLSSHRIVLHVCARKVPILEQNYITDQ